MLRCRSGLRLLRKLAFGLEPVPGRCRSLVHSSSLRLTSHSSRTRFVASNFYANSRAGRLNSGVMRGRAMIRLASGKTRGCSCCYLAVVTARVGSQLAAPIAPCSKSLRRVRHLYVRLDNPSPLVLQTRHTVSHLPPLLVLESLQQQGFAGCPGLHNYSFKPNPLRSFKTPFGFLGGSA